MQAATGLKEACKAFLRQQLPPEYHADAAAAAGELSSAATGKAFQYTAVPTSLAGCADKLRGQFIILPTSGNVALFQRVSEAFCKISPQQVWCCVQG